MKLTKEYLKEKGFAYDYDESDDHYVAEYLVLNVNDCRIKVVFYDEEVGVYFIRYNPFCLAQIHLESPLSVEQFEKIIEFYQNL